MGLIGHLSIMQQLSNDLIYVLSQMLWRSQY
jgi:hypothetical protein